METTPTGSPVKSTESNKKIVITIILAALFAVLLLIGVIAILKIEREKSLLTAISSPQKSEWKLTWVRNKNELPNNVEGTHKNLIFLSLLARQGTTLLENRLGEKTVVYPSWDGIYYFSKTSINKINPGDIVIPISNLQNDWATFSLSSVNVENSKEAGGDIVDSETIDLNGDDLKDELLVLNYSGGLTALDEDGKVLWSKFPAKLPPGHLGGYSNDIEIINMNGGEFILADIDDQAWLLNLKGKGQILWEGETKINADGYLAKPDILDIESFDSDSDGDADKAVIIHTSGIELINIAGELLRHIDVDLFSQSVKRLVILEDKISQKTTIAALVSDSLIRIFDSRLDPIKDVFPNEDNYQFFREITGLDLDGDNKDDSFLASTGQELGVYEASGKKLWGANFFEDEVFKQYRCKPQDLGGDRTKDVFTDFSEIESIKALDLDNDRLKDDFIIVAQKIGCLDKGWKGWQNAYYYPNPSYYPALLFFTR